MTIEPTTNPDAFAVHALFEGCVGELALNDVPLCGASIERLQASIHATPWIVDGRNELRLTIERARRLEILPMGAVALEEGAGVVSASARVMAGFYADLVPDAERDPTLATLVWGPVDDAARALPTERTATFVAAGRPRWAWQDAPVLDPSPAGDRGEVLAFVRAVHAAFVARDAAAVVATMPTLAREAIHFGPSSQDFAGAFAGEFARQTADPDFAVAPLVAEEVVLRPIAGGRVVRVLHRSGAPALRSPDESLDPWRFPLHVARVGGALEIVRLG